MRFHYLYLIFFLTNNMDIIIHPYSLENGKSLLHLLVEELSSGKWNKLQVAVAFAKESANSYPDLLNALRSFAQKGNKIQMTFGCDKFGSKKGSELAAIRSLLELLEDIPTVNIYLYHDKSRTFHPKIYLFSNEEQQQALLIIGSSNWTDSAFRSNVEANVVLKLDLSKKGDADQYSILQKHFLNDWSENPGSFARKLSTQLLESFSPLLATDTEDENDISGIDSAVPVPLTPQEQLYIEAESLFSGTRQSYSMSFRRQRRSPRTSSARRVPFNPEYSTSSEQPTELLWKKKLARSDTQSQSGHPTGGIRLTQAKWKRDGALIDHTQYFRNDVFGELEWNVVRENPRVEKATAKFHVLFPDGRDIGEHNLTISHKPSGEAGQGNYTTMLHWSDLGPEVRGADLTGKWLSLSRGESLNTFVLTIE